MESFRKALKQLRHSFYMPTLLAILCFIAVVVLLFNMQFFKPLSRSLEKDVYSMAQNQADYQAANLSSLLDEFANLSAKIVSDKKLSRIAYIRRHDSALSALRSYDLSFYKYDNLIIYYPGEEYLLTIEGTCKANVAFPEAENPEAILEWLKDLKLPGAFSTIAYGADTAKADLVFAYPYPYNRSVVLFLLKHDTVQSMLGLKDRADDVRHILLGGNGDVLFSDCALDEGTLKSVAGDSAPSSIQMGENSYLLLFSKMPLKVRLVTLNQVIDQFDEFNRIANLNVICCAAIILLGAAVLVVSYVRSYIPIAQLAESATNLIEDPAAPESDIEALRQMFLQYGRLSADYDRNLKMFKIDQLRSLFVLRILNGRYASNEESANICEHLGVAFPYEYYCACVLLFDGESTAPEDALNGIEGEGFTACFCPAENRGSALGVINCANPDALNAIGEAIMRCFEHGGALSTVAIGHAYGSLQEIPVSYIEARTAMDYRLMFGRHTVILYDNAALNKPEGGEYPRATLNAFSMGLLNWDVEEIQTQLSKLVCEIRGGGLNLQQVKCVCMELSTAFMREAHNISSAARVETEQFDVFHICEYDSIDELVAHITELSASIKKLLESRETLCQDGDIHRCLMMIEGNFENSQFSLESLYDSFSITPQTLRRRFKNATGKTMNDYLTGLRLNKAKRLLAETQMDLSEISAQCGYTDQSSFIRAFKAKEGETPGKYRETHRNI